MRRRRQTIVKKLAKPGKKLKSKIKINFRKLACSDLFYT